MKLPDFANFAPLNKNREQMNAEMPDDLSFVTIDDRVTNADLEKQRKPVAKPAPAPAQKAAAPQTVAVGATSEAVKGVKYIYKPVPAEFYVKAGIQSFRQNIVKTILLVQLVIVINFGLGIAALAYFGFFDDEPQITLATPPPRDPAPLKSTRYHQRYYYHAPLR